jgi:Methyltransferase domain
MLARLLGQLVRRASLSVRNRAPREARGALALSDGSSSAHALLARVELPGKHYLGILADLHQQLQPATYLEIGVFSGASLTLVHPCTDAIGIDPEPRIAHPLTERTRVFTETSDEFFARRNLSAEFGGRAVELAFIDGMHRFEFVLRDFINIEKHCSASASVLLHDCYPLDEATSSRERNTTFWSGDVWRAILALKKYRPDLRIATLAVPPTGLGVIQRLDPGSSILDARYDEIVADMLAVDYAALAPRKADFLNRLEATEANLRDLFA